MTEEMVRLERIRANLERRAHILALIRSFFSQRGYLEVETPLRVTEIAPESQILPVESAGRFLAASPELHMKRLLAAGYLRIFQIGRSFRHGERGRLHNPEFTLLEWYRQGADYTDMIDDTAALVLFIAGKLGMDRSIPYQGTTIDLELPWPSLSVGNLFREKAGWDPVDNFDGIRFDVDLVTKVLPQLPPDRPVIIRDYPAATASLARLKADDPTVAERAELFIAGLELANAFSELNDAGQQRNRFAQEIAAIASAGGGKIEMPENFLQALEHMPDCGGIALGLDRLVMLFCDAPEISDVLAFGDENA